MSRKSELESKIRDLESQIRDIKSRISDQEYKNDGYREQLRDIQTQINDYHERNYNEWISNQNEWRNDLGEYFEERGEYWDNRQQIRFYDKELSEVPRNNLKEGERIVKDYRRELSGLYHELHQYEDELGRAHSDEDDGYSYEGNSSDDDDYDDGYGEEDSYEDDYTPPPPAKEAQKIVIRLQKQDAYTSRRKALQDYAKRQNKPYKELPSVKGGYRALVGDTTYDYRNVDDLVISNSKGIPTLDDFKAILQEERRMGRNIMPLGEISSPEYKARLVLACDEVGIKPIGNIRIPKQDYGKLGLFTKIKYQKFIDKLDKSLAASRAAMAAAQQKKTR